MGKRPYKYIHTFQGKPAVFDGWQICVGYQYIELVDNLGTIKKERKITIANRTQEGLPVTPDDYGYVKVFVPQDGKEEKPDA